ncbi:MAG TPA: TIGR00300 family protein [Acidobacteriota bacterium]|nr:TIGR00300 family protein [Acidobacteriota bacterium]
MAAYEQIVEARGHLIDSGIMSRILDRIIEGKCSFQIDEFTVGKTNEDESFARIKIQSSDQNSLKETLDVLVPLGCYLAKEEDVSLAPAPGPGQVPDDFYSTTNYRTFVRISGDWNLVKDQRMDAVIRMDSDGPRCVKLRDIKQGDMVVRGHAGLKVIREFKDRERRDFTFMASEVSSERRVEVVVRQLAQMIRQTHEAGGKIVAVCGPVVVHTGGVDGMSKLIRSGYVSAFLGGNAIAVHDIEYALYKTSLGVHLETGMPAHEGHRNHMRAINVINHYGSIAKAVEANALRSGIMYELVKRQIPFALAGSIRDDGPLPDTITDMVQAQAQYSELLKGAEMVMILGTMLHGIGVGNMIPSWVRTICVDINPAVVTKLSDRGSAQTVGIITDVGAFLHLLKDQI